MLLSLYLYYTTYLSFYTDAKKIMKSKSISQLKEVVDEIILKGCKRLYLLCHRTIVGLIHFGGASNRVNLRESTNDLHAMFVI